MIDISRGLLNVYYGVLLLPLLLTLLLARVVVFLLFATPLTLRAAANFLTPPNMTEIPSPTTMGHTGASLTPAPHARQTKEKEKKTPLPQRPLKKRNKEKKQRRKTAYGGPSPASSPSSL